MDENSFLPFGKKGSATQEQNRDRFCYLPKSRSRQIILGTARGGQNYADAEYPPVHNRAHTIQKPPIRVVFLFGGTTCFASETISAFGVKYPTDVKCVCGTIWKQSTTLHYGTSHNFTQGKVLRFVPINTIIDLRWF